MPSNLPEYLLVVLNFSPGDILLKLSIFNYFVLDHCCCLPGTSFAVILRIPFPSVCVGSLLPESYAFIFLGLLPCLGGPYTSGACSENCVKENFFKYDSCLQMSVIFWLCLKFQIENHFKKLGGFALLASHSNVGAYIHNAIFTLDFILGYFHVHTPESFRIFFLIAMLIPRSQ